MATHATQTSKVQTKVKKSSKVWVPGVKLQKAKKKGCMLFVLFGLLFYCCVAK